MAPLKGYDAPLRLGEIYLKDEKWKQAEKYFHAALSINPKNPYAQTQLKKAKAKGQSWEGENIDMLKIKDKLNQ